MSLIPEGYELIAEGICSFSGSDKTYNGIWYHYEEDDSYYFCLGYDVNLDTDEEDEIEIYPVDEGNMVYGDTQAHGWFSKTMEEYSFVDLDSESEEDQSDEEEGSYDPEATGPLPKAFLNSIWGPQSGVRDREGDESDEDFF